MPLPVVIDANNVIARCLMAAAKRDLEAGVWNGGIYNSLLMLGDVLKLDEFQPGQVYAVFDHGIPQFRKDLIPDYKAGRRMKSILTDAQRIAAYKQIDDTREALKHLGVVCLSFPQHEADDVVAELCRRLVKRDSKSRPVVVSNDSDLFQLLTERGGAGCIVDPATKAVLRPDGLEARIGVAPDWYIFYKTLKGDTSDNVEGVPGIGEKRAVELAHFVRELMADAPDAGSSEVQLEFLLSSYGSLQTDDPDTFARLPAREQKIVEYADRLRNAREVYDLSKSFDAKRHGAALDVALEHKPEVKRMDFLRVCRKLGLEGVLANPERFAGPFCKAASNRA